MYSSFPVRPLIKKPKEEGAWVLEKQEVQKKRFKAIISSLEHDEERLDYWFKRKGSINQNMSQFGVSKRLDSHQQNLLRFITKDREFSSISYLSSKNKERRFRSASLDDGDAQIPIVLSAEHLLDKCKVDNAEDIAVLDISNSLFTDVNHVQLSNFNNLYKINASGNQFKLNDFADFPTLKELDLTLNEIKDLDFSIGNFEQLEKLNLSYNNLTAADILRIGLIPNLKTLDLSGNDLVSLPKNMCAPLIVETGEVYQRFYHLQELNLERNLLENGEDFEELAAFKNLQILNLSGNRFSILPVLECVAWMNEENLDGYSTTTKQSIATCDQRGDAKTGELVSYGATPIPGKIEEMIDEEVATTMQSAEEQAADMIDNKNRIIADSNQIKQEKDKELSKIEEENIIPEKESIKEMENQEIIKFENDEVKDLAKEEINSEKEEQIKTDIESNEPEKSSNSNENIIENTTETKEINETEQNHENSELPIPKIQIQIEKKEEKNKESQSVDENISEQNETAKELHTVNLDDDEDRNAETAKDDTGNYLDEELANKSFAMSTRGSKSPADTQHTDANEPFNFIMEKMIRLNRPKSVPIVVQNRSIDRNLNEVIRHMTRQQQQLNESPSNLPPPFQNLRCIDLSLNLLETESSVFPVLGWPMLSRIIIFDNPLTFTKRQQTSLLKQIFEKKFNIEVEWYKKHLEPNTKNIKSKRVETRVPKIERFDLKTLSFMKNAPEQEGPLVTRLPVLKTIETMQQEKLRKLGLLFNDEESKPGYAGETHSAIEDQGGKNKASLQPIFNLTDPESQDNELDEIDELEVFANHYDQQLETSADNTHILKNPFKKQNLQRNIQALKWHLKHPITYSDRRIINLDYKQNPLPPINKNVEKWEFTKDLSYKEKLQNLLESQKSRSTFEECRLDSIFDEKTKQKKGYFEAIKNRSIANKKKEASKILKEIQTKYDTIRSESLKIGLEVSAQST